MTLLGNHALSPAPAGFFYLDDTELAELWRHARRHANDLGRSELGGRLATNMRHKVPVFGSTWSKLITFRLDAGKGLTTHEHKRHAVIYYPQSCLVVIADEPRHVPAYSMLYLPPHTPHMVPPHEVERLSVAMLVDV